MISLVGLQEVMQSFTVFVEEILGNVLDSDTPFGCYVRSSTRRASYSDRPCRDGKLYPMPAPFPVIIPYGTRRSRRLRQRVRCCNAKRTLCNLICLGLSHLALGDTSTCLENGCTGRPLNAEQTELKHLVLKRVDSIRRRLSPHDTGAMREYGVKIPALADSFGWVASAATVLDFIHYCRMRTRVRNDNDDTLAACGA